MERKIFPTIIWKNLKLHILRDDLLRIYTSSSHHHHQANSDHLHYLSGNKIRKFYFLLTNKFDQRMNNSIVISYGGLQSNSMNAIALITSYFMNCQFIYFVKKYPKYLQNNPHGNLAKSLEMGMKIIEINSSLYQRLEKIPKTLTSFPLEELEHCLPPLEEGYKKKNIYWIPQGGALPEAEIGIQILCNEIIKMIETIEEYSSWKIFISSGTGTTALYLARYLAKRYPTSFCEVVAVPCVGTKEDLINQMKFLSFSAKESPSSDSADNYPTILPIPPNHSPTPFAQPTARHFNIWSSLNSAAKSSNASESMEFDLIYAPKSFELIEESYRYYQEGHDVTGEFSEFWHTYDKNSCQLIYYHCGGTEGNSSQLKRYMSEK